MVGQEDRFSAYLSALTDVIGHVDRAGPLRDYCSGLMAPLERKSVEPMAAATAPSRTAAQHQSLLHFVGQSPWSDDTVLKKVRALVLPSIERSGSIRAWIVDDTSFPKKGTHSVGVARQYCGQLGKRENCQTAVTLSVANAAASLPVAYRLYLPQAWANDPARRAKAGIPDAVVFHTKPQIALDQIEAALAEGIAEGVVLADAGYGNETVFRDRLTELGLGYAVGVLSNTSVWPPGTGPLPPRPWSGQGRPTSSLRRDADHQPVSVKEMAKALPPESWQTVRWREGTNTPLASRFAALRVRPAHRDTARKTPRPVEWLLIEWPEADGEPLKYWLSTLPEETSIEDLVDIAKLRWRIERDYLDLKQELGLGHYEGRGWRGFHHHATLCIAAYGFLISERETIPPSAVRKIQSRPKSPVPRYQRPGKTAAAHRTPHAPLHPDTPAPHHNRNRPSPRTMSLLPTNNCTFVTQ